MLKRVMMVFGASLAACGCTAAAAGAQPAPPLPKAANGHTVQVVAAGLFTPTSFAFGAGRVFEGDAGNQGGPGTQSPGGVFVLSHGSAKLLPGSPPVVFGLVWHRKTLYVSALNKILAWSGWNGSKFTQHKVIYRGPKGFPGFNGLAFGADGRLYAGVDVGARNDHGPATKKTPYLYDVLSFAANGKGGPRVVATGIRQPWQLAFPRGSSSPYVTDLGQDQGAKNPPDFVLRVRTGDDFGFPQCNHTKGSVCKGFAKPFKFLPAHADVGGIGIIGKRIYLSEFGMGGRPPQIVSMPLKGGKAKPFLTGFVAPVIGLGVFHGWVYVGDLSGHVYRVHV